MLAISVIKFSAKPALKPGRLAAAKIALVANKILQKESSIRFL